MNCSKYIVLNQRLKLLLKLSMWLLYALLSPAFWAIVHLLDWYCVEQLFEEPWMGAITSSLSSCIVFLLLPVLGTDVVWELPSPGVISVAILAGILIQMSQFFYFEALSYSEASIVAAYWNMTPIVLPLASFLLLGKVFQIRQYLGIAILILTSVSFCLADTNFEARWKSLYLMFFACCIQAAALLLEEHLFNHSSFFTGFLFIIVGIIISGILPLLFRSVRSAFFKALTPIRHSIPTVLVIELFNLAALLMSQQAIALGIPSLVAAVETIVPAYIFIFSVGLHRLKLPLSDSRVLLRLRLKLLLLGGMVAGIGLVS